MAENKTITLNVPAHMTNYLENLSSNDIDFVLRTGIYTLKESQKLAQNGGVIPIRRSRVNEISESTRLMRRMLSMTNREYKRYKHVTPYVPSPVENITDKFAHFTFNFGNKTDEPVSENTVTQ